MKAKNFYAYAFMVIFAFAICASSCSGDDDPIPVVEPKGEVSFVIDNGNGGGSTSVPTVVKQGEQLDMTISQKSSYTDSDGKVFVCEPKANIKLFAAKDTIYAKDFTTLTSVKQTASPTTSTSGTNPVLNKIAQSFDVGGQVITFDLGYEIYNYANAANQVIEMPYIKLNPAKYGAAETANSTRAVASVTGIRLTPMASNRAATRGVVVKDTAMYQVNISFNLDIESKNTGNDSTTPLTFEIEYTGAVENVTELPDPTTSFSYQLNILGGTSSTASPFEVTKGEVLSLEWAQNSQYTYFSATELSGKTVNELPKAAVKLSVAKDTLWVNSAEELEKVTTQAPVITTSGENPIVHTVNQSFDVGGQAISLDWSYNSYAPLSIDGNTVNLPYLELANAEVASVSKTELSGVVIPNKEAKVYEVTVKIRQGLKGVNTPESVSETEEYVVKYIAAVEVKLMSTTYEKGYEWTEAHDNLPVMTYYIVYRHRTYSTGETLTDTFICPYGWMVSMEPSISKRNSGPFSFVYHNTTLDEQDFSSIETTSTGVPDINLLSYQVSKDIDEWDNRNLNDYTSALYNYHYDSENPQEGWYAKGIYRKRNVAILYDETHYNNEWVKIETICIKFYDRFIYIDGQVIDFSDYRMTYDFDFREQSTTLSDGTPAKVFTHDLKAKYLGRDFYVATIDTIYQIK